MNPGTPFSLLLIAAGGILTWGVTDNIAEVNLGAIGVILMLVGALGLIMSLAFWNTIFGGRTNRTEVYQDRGPDVVVRDSPRVIEREVVEPRTTVVEKETTYRS